MAPGGDADLTESVLLFLALRDGASHLRREVARRSSAASRHVAFSQGEAPVK
jgi:hypothetical protein